VRTRRDLPATIQMLSPDELAGYERWLVHYCNGLQDRSTIQAAASLCLDGWPEYDDHQGVAFTCWLVQEGEAVVEAAVRDPDSIATCEWTGAPARVGDLELVYDRAIARGADVSDPVKYPLLPPPDWPADRTESFQTLVSAPILQQVFPRLVARLGIERLRNKMPRAPWQREAQERNRWWGLAWDALESREVACEQPRFWRFVDMIAWPKRGEVPAFETFGMPERIRFVLRFHERLETLDRAVAAHEAAHGPLVTSDREERFAAVIAGGRATFEATLVNPAILRESPTPMLGFRAHVDELRRAPASELLSLVPMELSDRADELPAGAIVVDYEHGYGFVEASSPGSSPDHVIYLEATVPIDRTT